MSEQVGHVVLLAAGALFVAFVFLKLLAPVRGGAAQGREGKRRIAEAMARARDRALTAAQRAAALREAAAIALEIGRPGLASSYAHRAERLDPHDAAAVGLLATALRRASRFRALERLLWRRIAGGDAGDEGGTRALQELIALYDGPLKRPEIAAGLRKLEAPSERA